MSTQNRPSKDFGLFSNMTRDEALAVVDRERDWRRPTKDEVNQYYDSILPSTKAPNVGGPS